MVTYENNVPTEGLNYLGRIRLNNSNGCAVVISDVTKEDTETVYYPDGVLPGQPRIALKMTSKKPTVHLKKNVFNIFFCIKNMSGSTVEVGSLHLSWSH